MQQMQGKSISQYTIENRTGSIIHLFELLVVLSIVSLVLSIGFEQAAFADNSTAKIDYTVKIGNQKHLVHLTVCTGKDNISSPSIDVYSPQETKELSVKKILAAHTCQSYEAIIHAKHANRIGVIVN